MLQSQTNDLAGWALMTVALSLNGKASGCANVLWTRAIRALEIGNECV